MAACVMLGVWGLQGSSAFLALRNLLKTTHYTVS